MKETKIFFVDLYPGSGLGFSLQRILKSCPNLSLQLHHDSSRDSESVLCDPKLSSIVSRCQTDLIFLVLPPSNLKQAETLLQSTNSEPSEPPIIVVIEACRPDEMFTLLKLGAADFITPPFKEIDILPRLWRLLGPKSQKQIRTHKLKEKLGLKRLVGGSVPFLDEMKKIPIVARCDASVLITGETGSGKELCARAIHYLSPRAGKPFIPFNCGAIPTELMENELFGHVQGAFTGASASKLGLINAADSGTLFLDDIDCLPHVGQVKLLRFLQEKEYRQLGSERVFQADVRIIAATNTDLEEALREGKLRRDLYYRLNIIPLMLSALRDRKEDIPLLASHFLRKHAIEFKKEVTGFTSEAMQTLMVYDWPGNVRELEHVVERTVLFSEHSVIKESDIMLPQQEAPACRASFREAKRKAVADFEKNYIEELMIAHQGNITKAARGAQKNRRAFWELIRKHRIDVQAFKPG